MVHTSVWVHNHWNLDRTWWKLCMLSHFTLTLEVEINVPNEWKVYVDSSQHQMHDVAWRSIFFCILDHLKVSHYIAKILESTPFFDSTCVSGVENEWVSYVSKIHLNSMKNGPLLLGMMHVIPWEGACPTKGLTMWSYSK